MHNITVDNKVFEHSPFTNTREFLSFLLSLRDEDGIELVKLYFQDFNGGYSDVWEALNFMVSTIDGYNLFYQEKNETNSQFILLNKHPNITLLNQRGEMVETNIQNENYSLSEEDYSKLETLIKELAKELLGIEK